MNLIFIYGPPATGKLTVAKELSKLTEYKVFHNHLTVDLVTSILDFGSKDFFKASGKLRLQMFELAAKNNINLIFTFCYAHPTDKAFIKKIINIIKKHKGKVKFVQLYCDKKELYKRVKDTSRKNFEKLKTIKGLKGTLKEWDLFTKIPFVKNLVIDNTNIKPKKAALMIKKHYKL